MAMPSLSDSCRRRVRLRLYRLMAVKVNAALTLGMLNGSGRREGVFFWFGLRVWDCATGTVRKSSRM